MARLPPHLRNLGMALDVLSAHNDAMLLSELDGFLTGVIVCPDLILPSEWMPHVCADDDGDVAFESPEFLQRFVELVMQHYSALVRELARGRVAPVYEVDREDGTILWEPWMGGFSRAMALRPDSWDRVVDGDDDVAADAMMALITLSLLASDDRAARREFLSELDEADLTILGAEAPDFIPLAVRALHRWRLSTVGAGSDIPRGSRRVGRNDPCPCGSGRKFKRCCGVH